MDSLTVELPKGLRQFLEAEATARGLGTAEACLIALARQEQERKAKASWSALVESLRSGPGIEADDAYWEDKLRRHEERFRGGIPPVTGRINAGGRIEMRGVDANGPIVCV